MSDNVIQALDDVALAIRELALSQYPPPTTELSDIAAAIAALDLTGGSSFDYRHSLEAIASAISNRACCPVPTEPLIIYDCATGEVRFINPEDGTVSEDPPPPGWRWPPRVPGGSGVAPEDRPPTGGVIIYEPEIAPPITFTESDPPYGYDPDDSFDSTPIGSGGDNRCEKANVFVRMTYDMLETMSFLSSSAGGVTLGALMATPAFAAWVGGSFLTWGPFVEVPAKIVVGVINVVYAAIEIFTNLIDFTVGWNAQVAEDLVCAIYNSTSQKDMKNRWDYVIEQHYDWFAPQAALMRMFLNDKWTGPLIDPTAASVPEAPRYGVVCATACETPPTTLTAHPVRRCDSSGASVSYYVIEWPASCGRTDTSFTSSSYKMAWHNPDNGSCPTPYNSGANYRGALNLTELYSNTAYGKFRILNCTSQVVREWYDQTWGWDFETIAVADANPSAWYPFDKAAMFLESSAEFQIEMSEEPL